MLRSVHPTPATAAAVVFLGASLLGCGRIGFVRDDPRCVSCDGGGGPNVDGGAAIDAAPFDASPNDAPPRDGDTVADAPPMHTITVEPVYPLAGANWNDYVVRSVMSADGAHQPDVACAGTEMMRRACVHGGERRKVELTGATSCAGMVLSDELGAFRWRCTVESGVAVAYSIALRENVGLADLIDWTALELKPNRFHATSPEGEWSSDPATWWLNPVREAPLNTAVGSAVVVLDTSGAEPVAPIYVVSTSRTSSGYRVSEEKVSFVVAPTATLSFNTGAALNCDGDTRACLYSATAPFVWVEGAFLTGLSAMGNAHRLVHFQDVHSGTIRLVRTFGGISDAEAQGSVSLFNSHACRISHVQVRRRFGMGITLGVSHHNDVYDVRISGQTIYAAHTTGMWNIFRRLHLSGYANLGAWPYSNTIILAEFAGINGSGAALGGGGASITTHATVANGNSDGYTARFGHLMLNAAAINFVESGFYLSSSPANTFMHVAAGGNDEYACEFDLGGATFRGLAVSGSNALGDCIVVAGASVDGTCAPTSGVWPMVQRPTSFSSVFVGPVSSDSVNGSESPTPVASAAIADVDWTRFEHWLRSFGRPGAEEDPIARGSCEQGGGACIVRDYRLRSSDTVLRGIHGVPTDSAPCPESVNGGGDALSGTVLTFDLRRDSPGDGDGACETGEPCVGVPQRFLANALEILEDDIGDDDSLCESDERCIYSPNIGAYQGEGDFEPHSCVFQDGPPATGITNVEMHFYPTNGV